MKQPNKLTVKQIEHYTKESSFIPPKPIRMMAKQFFDTMRENERLRDWLQYISFSSNGIPTVINGKDVPEKWQQEINKALRYLGEAAEDTLKGLAGPGANNTHKHPA